MRQTDEWEREAKARNREADKKHHMDLAQKKGWAVQANKGVMEQIRRNEAIKKEKHEEIRQALLEVRKQTREDEIKQFNEQQERLRQNKVVVENNLEKMRQVKQMSAEKQKVMSRELYLNNKRYQEYEA